MEDGVVSPKERQTGEIWLFREETGRSPAKAIERLRVESAPLDPKTKNIYLPTSDFESIADSDPKKPPQRRWKQGIFTVLVAKRNARLQMVEAF
jgi:hypothetical protein